MAAGPVGPVPIKNLAHLSGERIEREGLGEKRDTGIKGTVVDHSVARVPGREEDLEIRSPFEGFVGEPAAIHVGHDNVGEQ